MKKMIALLLSLIMVLSIAAGACAEKSYQTLAGYDLSHTVINYWNYITGPDNECLTRHIDKFNAENPYGITINQDSMSGDVLDEKLPVALQSGTGPQLLTCGLTTAALAKQGMILELSDIFDYPELGVSRDNYIDGLLDILTYEGGLYAMPFYIGVTFMFWNKDVYRKAGLDPEKAPRTWDEMYDFCNIIKEKLGDQGYYGLCFPYGLFFSIFDMMASYGGRMITIDPETNLYKNELYSDENINALRIWKRFYDEGLNPVVGNDNLFYSGIIANHISGPWAGGNAEKEYGIDVGYGLAPGGDAGSMYFCSVVNMNVTNNCKTIEEKLACYAWIAYWNSVEPCIDFSLSNYSPVYLKDALKDERVINDSKLASVSDFEGRTAWNYVPNGFTMAGDVISEMTSMFEAIALGGNIEECLKKASDGLDKIVEQANAERQAAQ